MLYLILSRFLNNYNFLTPNFKNVDSIIRIISLKTILHKKKSIQYFYPEIIIIIIILIMWSKHLNTCKKAKPQLFKNRGMK